jgi:hypothetical protein
MCAKRCCKREGVPLFPLGRVVATPAALELMAQSDVDAFDLLKRHQRGDWGTLSEEDARENGRSILLGYRVLSSYPIAGEKRIWIITEADRSITTLLLPSDY